MSLKFGKTIRTLSLSQNYLVLIKKKSVAESRPSIKSRDAGAKAGPGGPTRTKGHWRAHSANIYYPLSQSCIASIARYWLCIDKGVKRLGEFLSIWT